MNKVSERLAEADEDDLDTGHIAEQNAHVEPASKLKTTIEQIYHIATHAGENRPRDPAWKKACRGS